jgi:hypothetical protein
LKAASKDLENLKAKLRIMNDSTYSLPKNPNSERRNSSRRKSVSSSARASRNPLK